MNFTRYISILSIVVSIDCVAQLKPSVRFDRTFADLTSDSFSSCLRTKDGGYFLGGASYSYPGFESPDNLGVSDARLIKIDANGNTVWIKKFGGYGEDGIAAIIEAVDGGYILAGGSDSPPGGNKTSPRRSAFDFWIIKIDEDGNKLWEQSYGEGAVNGFVSIIATHDNNYMLIGYSLYNSQQNTQKDWEDYWVIKIDPSGNKIWSKTYGGNSNDFPESIIQCSDGGYLLGGMSRSDISADKTETYVGIEQHFDYWIVKINGEGEQEWDRTFGGDWADVVKAMAEVDGGYLIGGESLSQASGHKSTELVGKVDLWFIAIDYLGNMRWQKRIGGNDEEFLSGMKPTPDGNFVLFGGSLSTTGYEKTSVSQGKTDMWMIKIDNQAEVLWDISIGGSDDDGAFDGLVLSDRDFLLAGYSLSDISGDKSENSLGLEDGWVVKVEMKDLFCPPLDLGRDTTMCMGELLTLHAGTGALEYSWNGGDGHAPSSFIVDRSGTYSAKVTYADCVVEDYIDVQYTSTYCKDIIPNVITPNGDQLNDRFVVDLPDRWSISIFNRYGETLYESADYKNDWNGSEVASGIYFYKVINENKSREFKGWVQVIK